eukprot:CAMPEP_0197891800 /NCGR_PEP_ID=MMETSP1439-20131203/29757_1 /TAXON_ID=66791 /ORGANISM="Gonyaulax spinifera, Strain CCMP409" /LENGTH=125 /DNA_ID=CAMNT_0043511933 /DNA_START=81 /DNA_END=455 /DNA_ORIENTATION=-
MAQLRARSSLLALLVLVAALGLLGQLLEQRAFVPSPAHSAAASERLALQPSDVAKASYAAVLAAAATAPAPALALEEDEEGFDVRILAVVALPLTAVSWALFNVWRVAFRQVVRIGESTSGSSKI